MPSEQAAAEYDSIAPLYDAEYKEMTEDIGFYRTLADKARGPILELACGGARILSEVANPDWAPIVGLDISPKMLEEARRRLAAHPKVAPMFKRGDVRLLQGDMRSFSVPPGGFAFAIIALNSFCHLLEAKDQADCLSCVAQHVRPGGLLALDVFNPEIKDTHPGVNGSSLVAEFRHPKTGERVQRLLASVGTDLAHQCRRYVFFLDTLRENGVVRRKVQETTLRYFYRFEMEQLLKSAGFSVESVYGGYAFQPYTGREMQMLFVAKKQ